MAALRADAQRNREAILVAARQAFALEGPGVSLDEIARRAGVGPGTVHRHFPSKEALVTEVLSDRLRRMTDDVARLPFEDSLRMLAIEGQRNLALSAAVTEGGQLGDEILALAADLMGALAGSLRAAQEAQRIRADLTMTEIHAIVRGVIAMERDFPPEREGLGLRIVLAGLRPSGDGVS
jgi:AcrR family transcriptional regulator